MPESGFQLRRLALQVPKHGCTRESCEDVWREDGNSSFRRKWGLSDGASTCSGSRDWAEILAEAAVQSLFRLTPGHWKAFRGKLGDLRERWREGSRSGEPLPWFAEAALDRGAFATLLRVVLTGRKWQAEAWGDSCVFQVRGSEVLRSFPLVAAHEFDADPFLLASVPGHDAGAETHLRMGHGDCLGGDLLLLATDAVARWILEWGDEAFPGQLERWFQAADPQTEFQAWVDLERSLGRLKNDDSTLLVIAIP